MESIVPQHIKGKQLDLSETVSCKSIEEAMSLFTAACHRLLHPEVWHRFSGTMSAAFYNPSDDTIFEEGIKLAIDIPGPGLPAGDGYDWVEVNKVLVNGETGSDESLAVRLKVTTNPDNPQAGVAHFMDEGATSTFIISRKKEVVSAAYYGRNETVNTAVDGIVNKIRNTAVAGAALAGLSEIQWKKFLKGLLY